MATSNETLKGAQAAIQAGDFTRGARLAAEILADNPGDAEALYMAAVAARYLNHFEAAHQHLQALHTVMPEYGRAWQEAGHLARAQGHADEAVTAYSRAVRFNPALDASWLALGELHEASGRAGDAGSARAHA